jgi:hypothetical protein
MGEFLTQPPMDAFPGNDRLGAVRRRRDETPGLRLDAAPFSPLKNLKLDLYKNV